MASEASAGDLATHTEETPPKVEPIGCVSILLFVLVTVAWLGFIAQPIVSWADYARSAAWSRATLVHAEGGSIPSQSCGPRCMKPGRRWCEFVYEAQGETRTRRQEGISLDQVAACAGRDHVLVNPTNPDDAIVFRETTGEMYTMLALSSLVSWLYAAFFLVPSGDRRRNAGVRRRAQEHPRAPWLWLPEWRAQELSTQHRPSVSALLPVWAFAPVLAIAAACSLEDNPPPEGAYPAVACAALVCAAAIFVHTRRVLTSVGPQAFLYLPAPIPLRPGEEVGVDAVVTAGALRRRALDASFHLCCTKTTDPGGRDPVTSVLYEQRGALELRPTPRGFAASIRLALSAAESRATSPLRKVRWWLHIEAPAAGTIISFDLPVYGPVA